MAAPTSGVSAFDRDLALQRLGTETFDVLVIGGGVTGCGVALDAAARGLRTALVEARDFASGTSSRSSKLIHGGLRYLQQGDYRLVYEALAERQRLLGNAPHLVHPLPFLIPLFGRDGMVSAGVAKAYSSALWLYDLTGGLRIGKRHRRIDNDTVLSHFPGLRTERLVAGFLYWDAQADDARLTLALARTAAINHGAVVANYAPVASLIAGEGSGAPVGGARLVDGTEIRARVVVDAGGVWAAEISDLAGGGGSGLSIRPAKGIHLTVAADRLPCDYASVLSVPGDKRSIFVVPWDAVGADPTGSPGRYTYLGTTDTDYDGPLDEPTCTPDDVDYVLRTVNAWTSADLTVADVTGLWAGLRPLISDARSARTADLSRRHRVSTGPTGVVTVTGGKLTTYRRMAAETVDEVCRHLGRRRLPGSPTRRLPLWGAEGFDGGAGARAAATRIGIAPEVADHLARRYGSEARTVLAIAETSPGGADPLVPGLPYLAAEALFAARYEMVGSLTDILSRRTRALILDSEAATAAAADVARLVADELGWDEARQRSEVDTFVALVHRERSNAGLAPSILA